MLISREEKVLIFSVVIVAFFLPLKAPSLSSWEWIKMCPVGRQSNKTTILVQGVPWGFPVSLKNAKVLLNPDFIALGFEKPGICFPLVEVFLSLTCHCPSVFPCAQLGLFPGSFWQKVGEGQSSHLSMFYWPQGELRLGPETKVLAGRCMGWFDDSQSAQIQRLLLAWQ